MDDGASQSRIDGSREMDLVDLAAVLIRRVSLVIVIWVLCVVGAVAFYFLTPVNKSIVQGLVQLGTVPSPQVAKQDEITMSLVLFDSPMVLKQVVSGSMARFFVQAAAVPVAKIRVLETESTATDEEDFEVLVDQNGSIVQLKATVPVQNQKKAVKVINEAMNELVEHCRAKEAIQTLWLESIVAAQPDTPAGKRMTNSLQALASSIELTQVLRPANVRERVSNRYSLQFLVGAGVFFGLALGVIFALLVELFSRGQERNHRVQR